MAGMAAKRRSRVRDTLARSISKTASMVTASVVRVTAVVNKSILQRLAKLGQRAEIRIVASTFAGQITVKCVMEIIAPLGIEAIAAGGDRLYQPRIVQIAFRNQSQVPAE